MHLKDLKTQVNDSIKKISSVIHKDKKKKLKKIFFFIFLLFFFISVVWFFSNIFPLLLQINFKMNKNTDNPLLKSAEEAYENGFLENSALYYKTYINSNIKNVEKILAYKRLFEISVLKTNFTDALFYLDKIEEIDKKSKETHLDRIKIYLRLTQYSNALKEIVKNQQNLKRSIEFRELTAIYYMKIGEFKKALNILEKIPYNKREFEIHKKIVLCFLTLNQFKDSINYLNKIENKVKYLNEKKYLGEFNLLKGISKIFLNNYENAIEDLNKAISLAPEYKENAVKLLLFTNIVIDNPDEIFKIIENISNDALFKDFELTNYLGDYYIYKNDYQKSLYIYQQLEKETQLTKDKLMTLADLYYYTKNYNNSLRLIENLIENYNYKSPELYKNLSLLYGKINDPNNELFFLKEGLNNFRDDLDFYVRFSKLYLDKNEPFISLQYINEAKEIYENNKNIPYDKRLDILYILALQQSDKTLTEKELLNLREKEGTNIDYYFQIIKYYLEHYKFSDAKRELDTAFKLQINSEQLKILNTYKLVLSLYKKNNDDYQDSKKYLLNNQNNNSSDNINISVIYLYDNDYDKALDTLNLINIYSLPDDIKNKVLYLKSLCHFYKNELSLSLELVRAILENDPSNMKASNLKTLINNNPGVTK